MNEFEKLQREFKKIKRRNEEIKKITDKREQKQQNQVLQREKKNLKEDIKRYIKNKARDFFNLSEKVRVGLDGLAEMVAYCSDIKMRQLRKFFNELKRMTKTSTDIKNDLQRLMPLLAYAKGKGVIDDLFFEVTQTLIDNCEEKDKEKLTEFMEAIIAFHKFHGK